MSQMKCPAVLMYFLAGTLLAQTGEFHCLSLSCSEHSYLGPV